MSDPARVLAEVRRVLSPGAPIVCNEVLNATFFIDPYSPNTLRYWMAFNDHQLELGGDPFVGAKLGNLLQSVGFRDIHTEVKTSTSTTARPASAPTSSLLDRAPALGRARAARARRSRRRSSTDERGARRVGHDPNSVFFYSFIQARARAW